MISQDGNLLWNNSAEEERNNELNTHAVNDPCESTFCTLTDQITTCNSVSLKNESGMVVIKKNGDF